MKAVRIILAILEIPLGYIIFENALAPMFSVWLAVPIAICAAITLAVLIAGVKNK